MKKMFGLALVLVAVVAVSAFGSSKRESLLARFNGGIGVDPVSNVVVNGTTTTATPNTVRGIAPAGQIWRIADLDANVTTDGRIRVCQAGHGVEPAAADDSDFCLWQ